MPSDKILAQKKEAVKEFTALLNDAKAGVLVDYRGLTVEQDTKLRSELRAAGVDYKVIKNTLTKYSIKEAGLDGLEEFLAGPTAWAISNNDVITPAKVVGKFADEIEALEIKSGFMEGKVISLEEVNKLAKMLSKEELIAKIMGSMKSPVSKLVYALNALAEKKENGENEEAAGE